MLFYAGLLLISLFISIGVVSLYRLITSRQFTVFRKGGLSLRHQSIFEKVTTQFGLIPLFSGPQKSSKARGRSSDKNGNKKPWGW